MTLDGVWTVGSYLAVLAGLTALLVYWPHKDTDR